MSATSSGANESYVDAARRGRHTLGRYVLGVIFILFMWIGVGGLATLALGLVFSLGLGQIATEPSGAGLIEGYLVTSVGFVFFFLGVVLAVAWIHRRSPLTLITAGRSIDWRRVGLGFGVWFALLAVIVVVEFLFWPSDIFLGPNLAAFVPFALIALVLTPIQTTAEELFFRGYLMQGLSLFSRNIVFLALTTGVIFGVPHLANPEADAGFLLLAFYYIGFGVFIAWVSLRDGTTELAIGAHAANNFFVATILTAEGGIFNTLSLFVTDRVAPLSQDIGLVVMMVIFAVAVFVLFKRRPTPTRDLS